jgi:hypothetical protein
MPQRAQRFAAAATRRPPPRRCSLSHLHTPLRAAAPRQGFVHLLPAGGVMRVDVDAMNESLRTHGALRLRHAMRPDEAFGMVLNFDGGRRGAVGALVARGGGAARGWVAVVVRVTAPAGAA